MLGDIYSCDVRCLCMGKITQERLELLAGLPFVRSVEVIGREIRVGLDDGAVLGNPTYLAEITREYR